MKARILFIERKFWKQNFAAFSLEKVFEQIAKLLPADVFETSTVKVPFGNSFFDILKNLLFFRKSAAEIYHVTGQIHYLALVLPPEKTVLTIHDVGFMNHERRLSRLIIKKLFLDLPVRRLRFITTVSENTKKSILENTDCPPEKIRVIENPVQEHYLNAKRKEFNKKRPTILQIGITPNKNIPNLIEALKGIECRLRIIGNLTDDLVSALEAGKIVYENAYGLDDLEMRGEYENADLVTFCSTFEGFGLPVIEAQAMRTPVLTSDISPLREVAGGAAFLADPFDVESIREGVLKIIGDDEFRNRIVERGVENSKRFEPRAIAARYEKLYLEMLGGE
ncbi:MAG TPA: glycosyltransferase family 1 protein [Pyrinomonadaceae bacterium]|jgi:glycosyltransferase involved in cell wall biosynthesis